MIVEPVPKDKILESILHYTKTISKLEIEKPKVRILTEIITKKKILIDPTLPEIIKMIIWEEILKQAIPYKVYLNMLNIINNLITMIK